MGLYEYNMLDIDIKALILWDKGIFLLNRFEGDYSINLYSLYDFYVEAWYKSDINSIEELKTFKSMKPLEPYLDRINLNL
jgi:hypothetical protein